MSEMLSIASGFQYAINIGYDLYNDEKLQNFIPTQAALDLLEDILHSTSPASTERSRVLIGAYGKGKSHIVLMILSMLMKRDRTLFIKVMEKAAANPSLMQAIDNYYDGNNKILPVVITGSNTSIPQAFLIALQRTLSDNDMLDVMPETNYKAAVAVINRWKAEFPKTYTQFAQLIDVPVSRFTNELENYSTSAYETFERVYPSLTAGSTFNPFLGFDVVELYENAAKGIKEKGYTGKEEYKKMFDNSLKKIDKERTVYTTLKKMVLGEAASQIELKIGELVKRPKRGKIKTMIEQMSNEELDIMRNDLDPKVLTKQQFHDKYGVHKHRVKDYL